MTQPVDIEALRALMERAPDLDELRNDLSMPATATLLDALPSLLTELEALRAERGRMENGLKVAEDATLSQPAADAAHPPADALREAFLPMDAWDNRDETVLLLVDYADGDHPLDDSTIAITIGHNNDHNVGEAEGNGWEFAGWCWTRDHYVQGKGTPIGWMPLPHHLAALSEAPGAGEGSAVPKCIADTPFSAALQHKEPKP